MNSKYEFKIILTNNKKGTDFYMRTSTSGLSEEEKMIIDSIGRKVKILFENEVTKLEELNKKELWFPLLTSKK